MRIFQSDKSYGIAALPALVILAAVTALAGCGNDQSQQAREMPPTPVHAVTVKPQTVPVYSKFPGRVQGKETAQVIGQVTGVLQSKDYVEGSVVQKGDLLYTIDPKPYQATVDQRKAELASAKASFANASRVWQRTNKLYKSNAVSQAERDQALASYQADKAAVQQAKANLESARIDLGYTKVKAPITGVTSLREVDLGELVTANQTKLTTITQLDPVYVLFSLPEDDAFARQEALKEMGKQSSDAATRQATILLDGDKPFPQPGKVDFTQSTIDPDTGTVQLRAIVDNPGNSLMPGRYVQVKLRIKTLKNALVVPEQAISGGQQTQVLVIKDGKAKPKAVTLGPLTKQGQVILKGLSAGDQVIATGLGTVTAGSPVKVKKDSDANAEKGSSNDASTDAGGNDNSDSAQG